jgi:hypothetical protein
MVSAISDHLGLQPPAGEVEELKRDVAPEAVLDAIEQSSGRAAKQR